MIDALLYAVRDHIRAAGINYGVAECEVFIDGMPPPRMGNWFASVHGGNVRSGPTNQRNLDELYDFSVTLTMRVLAPLDTFTPSNNLARVPVGERKGFFAKVEQLRRLLHMNWNMTVVTGQTPPSANDNISAWATGGTVYGFVEPAKYQGSTPPTLTGGEWLGAEPDDDKFAVKSELKFSGARRLQPQSVSEGVFV